MASTKEIEMLADEGISLTVDQASLEILTISIDGVGRINWVVEDDPNSFQGVICQNIC